MTQAAIGVVLATCDGGRFLDAQIRSIVNQTHRPARIYVYDDMSSDDSLAIVERASRYTSIPVVVTRRSARLGFADNFLEGALQTEEPILAFSDQDDVWHPRKLEICFDALVASGTSLVLHSSSPVDSDLRWLPRRRNPAIYRRQISRSPLRMDLRFASVPGYAQLFRRQLLEVVDPGTRPSSRYGEGQMSHDEFVYFMASCLGGITYLPQRLALHRIHGSNTSGPPASLAIVASAVAQAGSERYLARRRQSLEYAEFLLSASRRLPAWETPLRRGARAWTRLADREALRAELYSRPTSLGRAAQLAKCTCQGAYRSRRQGGSGIPGLIKDALLTMPSGMGTR